MLKSCGHPLCMCPRLLRVRSAAILRKMNDKYVATIPPSLTPEQAIFDDIEGYPDAPYALVGGQRRVRAPKSS